MAVVKYKPTIPEFIEFFRDLYIRCAIKYNEIDEILQLNAHKYGFDNQLAEIKRAVKSKEEPDLFKDYPEI